MEIDIVNNLNPKYELFGYDINIIKEYITDISTDELLSTIPITTYEKNTLLYHFSNEKQKIGNIIQTDENITKFSLTIDINNSKKNDILNITINNEPLLLLDITQLSVEIGFNPFNYTLNNMDKVLNSKKIIDYCKQNKYDGYINLEPSNNNNCYIESIKNEQSYVCPIIYLLNYKKYGLYKTFILGQIDLYKKNGNKLDITDVYKLNTLLFCNISNLYEINNDIKVTPYINDGKIMLSYNEKNYDIKNAYKNKNIINILHLNYINLQDECNLEFNYSGLNNQEPFITNINNTDIISSNKIINTVSDKLMTTIINEFAIKNDINPILLNNYDMITKIPIYTALMNNINQMKSINDLKKIFIFLEKYIVQNINNNYLQSVDEYKSTIQFINLQYINTTYNYLINKIMGEITNKPLNDMITIIRDYNYDKKNKIYKFYNADILYIMICHDYYNNHKKLYDGLFEDISTYKHQPIIKLKFIKFISKLDYNDYYNQRIHIITNDIYNYYKNFIVGNILLINLEDFMKINEIYEYIKFFATKNNINISILLYYDQILKLPIMKNFKKENIYDMSLEEFIHDINRLKLYILIIKYATTLADYYKLKLTNKQVLNFLTTNVEKYISTIDLSNDHENYYNFLINDINDDILRFLINNNNNDVMIDYIYDLFKLTLDNKNAILQLVKNKNLYILFINYLQGNMTKEELKNIIYFTPDEENIDEENPKKSNKINKEEKETSKSKRNIKKQTSDSETEELED